MQPKTQKQEVLVKTIRHYINSDEKLNLPYLGGKFEHHVYDIGLVVQTIYEEMDKATELLKQDIERQGRRITCKKGCSYCCSQPIDADITEAILITQHLDQNQEKKSEFIVKYPEWRKQVNPEAYTQRLNYVLQGKAISLQEALQAYSQGKNALCPFLKNSECVIYEVRPTVCRALISLDNPEICKEKDKTFVAAQGKTLQKIMEEKAAAIQSALMDTLGINAVIKTLMPMGVYEFNKRRKEYIESTGRIAKAKFE